MEAILKIVMVAVGMLALALILGLLTALPVYLLWNWLMPELFHLPIITFWQALGIAVLSSILFKSSSSKSSSK